MKNQQKLFPTLLEFAEALKKDYSHEGDYSVALDKDLLVVEAEFYSHKHLYRIKLTKEQKSEVRENLAWQKKHPYSANDIINADDDIISLFPMSLRKEMIDSILTSL